ncbi:MAG: class I SAM-dependent methyltransferase [Parachlamydiaceae bacterium]
MNIYFVSIFFLLICLSVVTFIVYWSWLNGISPMPTSSKAKKTLLKALPPGVRGNVYELGSGWGTLVFPLATHYPYSRIIGHETSPIPYLVSKMWLVISRAPNVTLKRQSFHCVRLDDASLIVCYLYPKAMSQLRLKFEDELKPGTWIVSNTFAIPGWAPETIVEVEDLYRTKIYLYQIKAETKTTKTNPDKTT